jgi:hypothetical protein
VKVRMVKRASLGFAGRRCDLFCARFHSHPCWMHCAVGRLTPSVQTAVCCRTEDERQSLVCCLGLKSCLHLFLLPPHRLLPQ